MEIDLHRYHPSDIIGNGVLANIVQAGVGNGRDVPQDNPWPWSPSGISPGFVNTNTGFFGLAIRSALRHDELLRKWIKHTTLDCSDGVLRA